jgi:hypothetical protein
MDTNKFTDLPDWDDEMFRSEEEEGEDWKPNPTREACKTMFGKWQEVVFLLNGIIAPFLEKGEGDESMMSFTARDLFADACMVGAKIKSSEAGGIYVIRMENAAIIRKLAQGIATHLLLFIEDTDVDESYIEVVRSEISAFRLLFIDWVRTFEKDEYTDEWGLFI